MFTFVKSEELRVFLLVTDVIAAGTACPRVYKCKFLVCMSEKVCIFAAEITLINMDKKTFWKQALEFIVKVLQIAIAVFLGGSINL